MNFGDNFFAILFCRLHGLAQTPVAQRIHGGKAEVFKFESNIIDTQTLGNRRINVECFASDTSAFGRGQNPEGAHIVQSVGELYQNHANISRHGQGHFLETFCLLMGF